MSTRNFRELSQAQFNSRNCLCVGLDTDFEKLLIRYRTIPRLTEAMVRQVATFEFNRDIIEVTKPVAGFYKLNRAFYDKSGPPGLEALKRTIAYIHEAAPQSPVILDIKAGDVATTAEAHASAAFDYFNADAVTVNPYLGMDSIEPFLKWKEKGIFVLARTSNKGAGEFQDLICSDGLPLFLRVAKNVAERWNTNGNCGLVVGATYPEEVARVRAEVGDLPILAPGIGRQGGELQKTLLAGKDSRGQGIIINSSGGIIYADDPGFEAQKLHDRITQILKGEVA